MSPARPERLLGIIAVLLLVGAIIAVVAWTSSRSVPGVASSGEPTGTGEGPDGATEAAVVIRVVDGDTIVVRIRGQEERVRYIGVDAPEVASAGAGSPGECGGDEARAANERLVAGEQLVLERDVSDRDRFGRLLRHAWLEDSRWRLVGVELVEVGAAEARSYPPDTRHDAQLDGAERSARDRAAGIWGAC